MTTLPPQPTSHEFLQLYNSAPERVNIDCVGIVLLNALCTSTSDFLAASYLVPVGSEANATIAAVFKLSAAVESCQFAEMWNIIAASPELQTLITKVPTFNDQIRNFIYQIVSTSFTTIQASLLKKFWNAASEQQFTALLASFSLPLPINGIITMPINSSSKTLTDQPNFEIVAKSLRLFW